MCHKSARLRACLVAALLALTASASACGDDFSGGEFNFLHVFNGYPATQNLSLYGPQGTVAQNVEYGKRTQSFQRVNRNLGTSFEVLYEGTPQAANVSLPLYSLYPQETATVFFKRRTGSSSIAQPILYRHLQTGHDNSSVADQTGIPDGFGLCRLVIDNALSVRDLNLTSFNFVTAMKMNPACTGYTRQVGSYDDSGTTVETESGRTIQVGRPRLWQTGDNADTPATRPWFFPAASDSGQVVDIRDPSSCDVFGEQRVAGENGINFIWAGNVTGSFDEGNIRATLPTNQYMNCIGWDPDSPPEEQNIDSASVKRCQRGSVTLRNIESGSGIVRYQFPTGIGLKLNDEPVPPDQCGFGIRVYSDFFNIFVEEGKSTRHFQDDVTFKPNQYHFWVLYGRPVNPRSEQWSAADAVDKTRPNAPKAGGGIVELDDYVREDGSANGNGN